MAKKTPAATENTQDSAQELPSPTEAIINPQADSTAIKLPFEEPRKKLIDKFRANAVPREADYKQLLEEHYAVAGAIGMGNNADNQGDKPGSGLVLNTSTGKLNVLAKEKGGLSSGTDGISLVVGPSLVIGTDSKVGVKINNKNGLKISTDGEVGVNLFSNNTDSDSESAAVITNSSSSTSGLWVNVGAGSLKKGLKQYKGSASGAVLGVSHDDTLKIDTTGKLGVNTIKLPVTSASAPLVLTNGKLALNFDNNSLVADSGKLQVNATSLIPKGTIVMFSGTNIPAGWAICDGRSVNGVNTPNLVNKFIRGASISNVNTTGGANSQSFTPTGVITVVGHSLTESQIPPHRHHMYFHSKAQDENSGSISTLLASQITSVSPSRMNVIEEVNNKKTDPHTHSANFQGNSVVINALPEFYTLIFIIKL